MIEQLKIISNFDYLKPKILQLCEEDELFECCNLIKEKLIIINEN